MGISTDYEVMAKKVQEYTNLQQQQGDNIADFVLQLENVCTRACVELLEEFNLIKSTTSE